MIATCPPRPQSAESGQVRILSVPLAQIHPSPENETLYRPINPTDPDVIALAVSIGEHGVRQPLALTLDYYITGGHRRYAAAKLAGLSEVPCIFEKVYHADPEFLVLLREHNRQRVKTFDEVLREEVISANKEEAYQELVAYRRAKSVLNVTIMEIGERKDRAKISAAKWPFLQAVIAVLRDLRDYWPVSERRVHYGLLNDPPLRHASKPDSRYRNDKKCSKDLSDLITRARCEGPIKEGAIGDDTRPVTSWNVHDNPAAFISAELKELFCGYYRNLQQSQPTFFAAIGEKSTLDAIIRPVLSDYTIPYFLGRGFTSHPPMNWLRKQFVASGKEHCTVLLLTDHDPDGEVIASSVARILRDEKGMPGIRAIRVALTADQVTEYKLPESVNMAKTGGKSPSYKARRKKFVDRYGEKVYELEALPPETLQEILRGTIESVIDREAFAHEVEQEKLDAAELDTTRRQVLRVLQEMKLTDA